MAGLKKENPPIIEAHERRNMIRLIKAHRRHCDGDCVISLNLIKHTLTKLGFKIKKNEEKLFI